MYKILKYPAGYEKGKLYTWCPDGEIIRSGYVEDTTYKGYWAWVLVDMSKPQIFSKRFCPDCESSNYYHAETVQIGIIESQTISIPMGVDYKKLSVKKVGGIFYITHPTSLQPSINRKLLAYKTGQEINHNQKHYQYIGYQTVVIKDEICIYYFLEK